MKIFIAAICLLASGLTSYAQETMEVRAKLTNKITAIYHVLVNNKQSKQGLYQVVHNKTIPVASGAYTDNKRSGIWHFFDYKGTLNQNFNYDTNTLTYEAQGDLDDGFKYKFDKSFTSTDTVTKPMKIGGRFYGYLPLLIIFKKPAEMRGNGMITYATIELLVSPAGNLADYTIHLDYMDLNVNLNLIDRQDKLFIPAFFNREPIASRITIECYINLDGELKMISQL